MLSDLDAFLEEDANLRQTLGSTSIEVELKFGSEGNTPTVTDAESPLRFRGQIDRLDLTADGRSVLVIDYKTGKPDYFRGLDKDAIDRGKHLQLAIYSLAAREIFPNSEQVRAAYWFATTKGGFKQVPSQHFDLGDPQTLKRFRQGISTISDGIRAGAFPANPGPPDRNKMPTAPIATSMPSAPPAEPTSGTGRSKTPLCLGTWNSPRGRRSSRD